MGICNPANLMLFQYPGLHFSMKPERNESKNKAYSHHLQIDLAEIFTYKYLQRIYEEQKVWGEISTDASLIIWLAISQNSFVIDYG